MKSSKQIIGFINTTLRGYRLVMSLDATEERRAHKIISAIVGDMPVRDPITVEVLNYCNEHYGYHGQ